MGTRDLVFIGLVIGGATALGASLIPPRLPKRAPQLAAARPAEEPSLQTLVESVDAAFRKSWDEQKVRPTAPAPAFQVVRRISLGLTGTIPSLEEVRQLERWPESDRASLWVDRLLRDRRYADHVAERLARAYVGTEGGPFIVFRRRRFVTWLSDQILANRPYHEIVRDLIAGDGLWTDRPNTNFVTVTWDPEAKVFDAERLAGTFSRAFLGARIGCAQCHDHPFAEWKQADFQGLAAFFGQATSGLRGLQEGDLEYTPKDRKTGEAQKVAPRVPFREDCLPDRGNRRERLAGWVTNPSNPALARATVNRAWAILSGKPMVSPIDDLPPEEELPEPLRLLADDFAAHNYDLSRLFRAIARTEVFRLDSAGEPAPGEPEERAWAVFPLTPLRPEQVIGSLAQAGSLATLDGDSPILIRIIKTFQQSDFIKRYGDFGDDEFEPRSVTIPQRLLMMNGEIVEETTKPDLLTMATRVAQLAPDDTAAVEVAYLTVLSRKPTPEELAHFTAKLDGSRGDPRAERVSDLFWTLVNSTEFSWNH